MNNFFDFDKGDFSITLSDNMAMNSNGDLLMRMSDNTAMDMNSGNLHFTSGWAWDDDE